MKRIALVSALVILMASGVFVGNYFRSRAPLDAPVRAELSAAAHVTPSPTRPPGAGAPVPTPRDALLTDASTPPFAAAHSVSTAASPVDSPSNEATETPDPPALKLDTHRDWLGVAQFETARITPALVQGEIHPHHPSPYAWRLPQARLSESIETLAPDARLSVSFGDSFSLQGTVESAHSSDSVAKVGFTIAQGDRKAFAFLTFVGGEFSQGFILAPKELYSYRLTGSGKETIIEAVDREELLPDDSGLVVDSGNATVLDAPESTGPANAGAAISGEAFTPPILESLPGAAGVLYLDFDGQDMSGESLRSYLPSPYYAAPAQLSDAQIEEVWKRVAADFAPYTINVTTSEAVFLAAPNGQKLRVVITSTAPTSEIGGVAMIGAWNGNDDPVLVFSVKLANYPKYIAEAASHESGHGIGLSHDGTSTKGYYEGHGMWAPIMGVGYYKPVSQWSKGEYPDANNRQDDLTIMDGYRGIDYRSDAAGSTLATALPLQAQGSIISYTGVVEKTSDIDVLTFSHPGGALDVTVTSTTGLGEGNLNVKAELSNSLGEVLQTASPEGNLNAPFSTMTLPAGTYYLSIDGVGEGDLTTGYSDYGSIGVYQVVITLGSPPPSPSPSPSASPSASATASSSPSASPSASASATPRPSASATPSPSATRSASPTPSSSPRPYASRSPVPSASGSASPTPSASPRSSPSVTPSPSATPSVSPSPGVAPAAPQSLRVLP